MQVTCTPHFNLFLFILHIDVLDVSHSSSHHHRLWLWLLLHYEGRIYRLLHRHRLLLIVYRSIRNMLGSLVRGDICWRLLLRNLIRSRKRKSLYFHLVDNTVGDLGVKHIYDSVQGLFLLQVELLLVVLDNHREKVLIVSFHALALEVMVLELTLVLNYCSAQALEVKDALL